MYIITIHLRKETDSNFKENNNFFDRAIITLPHGIIMAPKIVYIILINMLIEICLWLIFIMYNRYM